MKQWKLIMTIIGLAVCIGCYFAFGKEWYHHIIGIIAIICFVICSIKFDNEEK